jgi:hypothetical protein
MNSRGSKWVLEELKANDRVWEQWANALIDLRESGED